MNVSTVERISGGILLVASALLLIEVSGPQYAVSAADEGVNPGFIPKILLFIWLLLALILLLRPRGLSSSSSVQVNWLKCSVFLGMTIAFFIAVSLIGFVPATVVFLCFCPIFMGFRPYWGSLVFGLVSTTALWVIFEKFFRLVLPTGQLLG